MTARLLIFAPNWLGDAVMALPAMAGVQAALRATTIDVAARPSVAPLFTMTPGVSRTITITSTIADRRASVGAIRDGGYDAALLLPNSFNVALMTWSAGIAERWGYGTDCRGLLLTRSVAPPLRVHQAEYYSHLTRALGFAASSSEPRLQVSDDQRAAAGALLARAGWDGRTPLVGVAPGAAFGGAKRWPASSFAALIDALSADGIRGVLLGSAADSAAAVDVASRVATHAGLINLTGRTDLPTLAAVLVHCRALVTNDSGAMHVAAALGVNVIAMFGPTNERETHPIGSGRHAVLTHSVWCRPCMLRECPLTHRCMKGITVDSALAATRLFVL